MTIDARDMDYIALNEALRAAPGDVTVEHCLGQRFLGAGAADKHITVCGTPGNALGAYLNGAVITVRGNAQDAVGDTMNDGTIVVHGFLGDTAGYAMRGGAIYCAGSAGYRAGIHMKAYQDKLPVLVIGGRAGNFLGEYQAGGLILVLGLHDDGRPIVGQFAGTGMHGGRMVLRSDCAGIEFPPQVTARPATAEDRACIRCYVETYCALFGGDAAAVLAGDFTVVEPDSSNPYHQLYVEN